MHSSLEIEAIKRGPTFGGVIGVVQAVYASLLTIPCWGDTRPSCRVVFAAIVIVPLIAGLVIDRARNAWRFHSVHLLAPGWVRVACAAFVAVACAAFVAALLCSVARSRDWLCVLPTGFILIALLFDRVIGPAWILASALRAAWARRTWKRLMIIDGMRVELETGAGHVPRDVGIHYVWLEVERDRPGAGPYRSEELRPRIRDGESLEARRERRQVMAVAFLALLQGLFWPAVLWLPSICAP